MAQAAPGPRYGVETFVQGALALAKGLYHPTLPLRANIRQITDVQVPVERATLQEVKGRAYVFGGLKEGVSASRQIELRSMYPTSSLHTILHLSDFAITSSQCMTLLLLILVMQPIFFPPL